jgi:hypothetical protein
MLLNDFGQAADLIKLVGNFVTNCQNTEITSQDIKTATDGDRSLAALTRLVSTLPSAHTHVETITVPYGDAIKEMLRAEQRYLHTLELVEKVFIDTAESRDDVFTAEVVLELFGPVKAVIETTQGLYNLLEGCIESHASRADTECVALRVTVSFPVWVCNRAPLCFEGLCKSLSVTPLSLTRASCPICGRFPPVGSCFYSAVLEGELAVYQDYAERFNDMMGHLTTLQVSALFPLDLHRSTRPTHPPTAV